MLALVKHLDKNKLHPRSYVIASTDRMGAQKAATSEKDIPAAQVLIHTILWHPCHRFAFQ